MENISMGVGFNHTMNIIRQPKSLPFAKKHSCGGHRLPCVCTALCMYRLGPPNHPLVWGQAGRGRGEGRVGPSLRRKRGGGVTD